MKSHNYLIRTTCSPEHGTGHLRRSMVIAENLINTGVNAVVLTDKNQLAQKITKKASYVSFVESGSLIPNDYLSNLENTSMLIFDLPQLNEDRNYVYGKSDVSKIAHLYDQSGIPVVSIGHVNHISRSFRAVIDLYPGKTIHSANYIGGPEFVILNSIYQDKPKQSHKRSGILISLGGSDPFDITSTVLNILSDLNIDEKVTVVLGVGYGSGRMQELMKFKNRKLNVDFVVDTTDMKQLIRDSRIAFVGFGTTTFECMSQGTPSITFTHYHWQEQSAQYFQNLDCCKYIGCADNMPSNETIRNKVISIMNDVNLLQSISKNAMELVDGLGAQRIVESLSKFVIEKQELKLNSLFILAHPGDEIFGCGGTILKKVKQEENIGIVFLGEGYSSRYDEHTDPNDQFHSSRKMKANVQSVMESLGIKVWYNFQYEDNSFDKHHFLDFVKLIEKLIERHQPNEVYTHNSLDLNIDHKITFEAVHTACRPLKSHSVKILLSVEVPSSSDWGYGARNQVNWVNDISSQLDDKIKLASLYQSEIRDDPHPRSLDGIRQRAIHFGRVYGIEAAEIFYLQRRIEE